MLRNTTALATCFERIGPVWLFSESSEDEDGVSAHVLPLRCSLSAEAALDQQTRRCQALGRRRDLPGRPLGDPPRRCPADRAEYECLLARDHLDKESIARTEARWRPWRDEEVPASPLHHNSRLDSTSGTSCRRDDPEHPCSGELALREHLIQTWCPRNHIANPAPIVGTRIPRAVRCARLDSNQ